MTGALAGANTPERRRAAAALLAKKQRGKARAPADPELLRRIHAGGGNLVATGPPRDGQSGIVKQSFRAGQRGGAGGNGTTVNGGGGESGSSADDAGDGDASDPKDCGAPRVEKIVVDLKARPDMRAAFDVPSQSFLISRGMGELFSVGGAPAFVILIPQSRRASAGAIFDDRYLVLIKGQCIPDREYVKSLLRQ